MRWAYTPVYKPEATELRLVIPLRDLRFGTGLTGSRLFRNVDRLPPRDEQQQDQKNSPDQGKKFPGFHPNCPFRRIFRSATDGLGGNTGVSPDARSGMGAVGVARRPRRSVGTH